MYVTHVNQGATKIALTHNRILGLLYYFVHTYQIGTHIRPFVENFQTIRTLLPIV
jgi:hypothetical protein